MSLSYFCTVWSKSHLFCAYIFVFSHDDPTRKTPICKWVACHQSLTLVARCWTSGGFLSVMLTLVDRQMTTGGLPVAATRGPLALPMAARQRTTSSLRVGERLYYQWGSLPGKSIWTHVCSRPHMELVLAAVQHLGVFSHGGWYEFSLIMDRSDGSYDSSLKNPGKIVVFFSIS